MTKTFKQFIKESKKDKINLNTMYSSKEFENILTSRGWKKTSMNASHAKFVHPDSPRPIIAPTGHSGDMNKMLTRRLLKQAMKV